MVSSKPQPLASQCACSGRACWPLDVVLGHFALPIGKANVAIRIFPPDLEPLPIGDHFARLVPLDPSGQLRLADCLQLALLAVPTAFQVKHKFFDFSAVLYQVRVVHDDFPSLLLVLVPQYSQVAKNQSI